MPSVALSSLLNTRTRRSADRHRAWLTKSLSRSRKNCSSIYTYKREERGEKGEFTG